MWEPQRGGWMESTTLQFIRPKETLLLEAQDEPQRKGLDLKPFGLVGVRTNGKVMGFPQRMYVGWTSQKLEAECGEVARGMAYTYIIGGAIRREI